MNRMNSHDANNNDVDSFHQRFYNDRLWEHVSWMGLPAYKCPMDLWVYQEIMYEVKPDLVIECGTGRGGTALFLVHLMDIFNKGRLITIDIHTLDEPPIHPRLISWLGDTVSRTTLDFVRSNIIKGESLMVILDSAHGKEHVLKEMSAYGDFVTVGNYLIVEDTNINGHPVFTDHASDMGPGPYEAVEEFIDKDNRFEIDRSREKFLITFNPCGYLRRTR